MIQLEVIYLKVSLLTSVGRCLSPQINLSHVIILAHHATADNPLAREQESKDVQSAKSLSEGETHPGQSVVTCLLERTSY